MSSLRKKSLFDGIAPIYDLFFNYQVRSFRTILSRAGTLITIPPRSSVLDIGCGTGALALCLHEMGYRVTGADASPRMIAMARKNNRGNGAAFVVGDALDSLPFRDKSFDLVIASYVVHGLKKEQRARFYNEARRLARTQVIFQDYNGRRKVLSDVVEWLERGDYFYFIGHAREEMKDAFGGVDVRSLAAQVAWYICTP